MLRQAPHDRPVLVTPAACEEEIVEVGLQRQVQRRVVPQRSPVPSCPLREESRSPLVTGRRRRANRVPPQVACLSLDQRVAPPSLSPRQLVLDATRLLRDLRTRLLGARGGRQHHRRELAELRVVDQAGRGSEARGIARPRRAPRVDFEATSGTPCPRLRRWLHCNIREAVAQAPEESRQGEPSTAAGFQAGRNRGLQRLR